MAAIFAGKDRLMGKGIYTYYKERLIEIGGNSKCLYLKNVLRRGTYDIGRLFEGREEKIGELLGFLFSGGKAPLTLISDAEKEDIIKNIDGTRVPRRTRDKTDAPEAEPQKKPKAEADILSSEIAKIRELKREVEEIERETGRCELYVGYPFVFGSITRGASKSAIKAPLMLFPVKIEIIGEDTVEIRLNEQEKIRINPALVLAIAQAKRLNIDGLELEFDSISRFSCAKDVTDHLRKHGIRIDASVAKSVYAYSKFKEPDTRGGALSVRYGAVLGRFSLSSSIYNDYSLLEKSKLTNDAINELLRTRGTKTKQKNKKKQQGTVSYPVKMLDFAQSEVVSKVDKNGNMVIYGPPGTGKSQTIVNVITDAVSKGKRVLVVSQKRAALDVVYSRLGTLNKKAMYLTDEGKEKQSFYERCLTAHQSNMIESLEDLKALEAEYLNLESKVASEVDTLNGIYTTLNSTRPFGLSLSEMYSSSYMIAKSSTEYAIYLKMVECPELMRLNYKELSEALFGIRSMNLEKTYYEFVEDREKNPLIDTMLRDIDILTLSEVKGALLDIAKTKRHPFNIGKYPYYRQALAYLPLIDNERNIDRIVSLEVDLERAAGAIGAFSVGKRRAAIKSGLANAVSAIKEYTKDYECLRRVFSTEGYLAIIDNLLRGNAVYIKQVHDAIDGYIAKRDTRTHLEALDKNKITILRFAYSSSKSYSGYVSTIEKLLDIRIYHEVIRHEEECKAELSRMVDYPNVTSRIYKLKEAELSIAERICSTKSSRAYESLYASAKNNKDFLYQISKKQNFWPIRKTVEVYGDLILSLFPCWLLSPENVSNLLPLTKNLFDIVIFDEASQVFIESTIPTIYRGKNIVVAGDAKQLRPSATFMKRYLGADHDGDDYSMQAALEVDSLLDLAVARYESANLTYHYRSRHEELINFSNFAFYSAGLNIAPNIARNSKNPPIERYLVDGRWQNRRNEAEARRIVELLCEILKTRKNNESIGIITFNSDQQTCIQDMIDKEALKDEKFRAAITSERTRTVGGEDVGLFIKNLENVQGEERDIIIFSIGYAKNEEGRIYTNFGSLSTEGGENRLNVAITRAKSKIIVVTSIEPEELKVDAAKNRGPKLLKTYLQYVRAISDGAVEEANTILLELSPKKEKRALINGNVAAIDVQIKERLTKLGYKVDLAVGNENNRLTLAVFDEKTDKYLVGVELDTDAVYSSASSLERDVYKPKFLESRGWQVMRVWCRDWWLYPGKVVKAITAAAEKAKRTS